MFLSAADTLAGLWTIYAPLLSTRDAPGMTDDLDDLGGRNCERCLIPMSLDADAPVWRCSDCGLVAL
jgi:hypothetical protein